MFADVSHELKTPLTAMLGYLDTMQMPEMEIDSTTRARYLDTVRQETRRLERIVKDLLDLARYENGVGSLDVRVFAIERVFEAVIRRHEREAHERGIGFAVHVDPSADQIVGDPDRLEQVVENLVANALRHTPSGGTIELHAAAVGDGRGLAVVDSGEASARGRLSMSLVGADLKVGPYIFCYLRSAPTSPAGSSISKTAPPSFRAVILPPCRSTMVLTIERPRPLPPAARRAASTL
jgi:signal transduction histidine kinase